MQAVLGLVGGKPSRARRIVLRNNGIKARHYAIDPESGSPTHDNARLTAEAIRRLEGSAFALADMDCLVCGTSLPDQMMPNHAVMVHGELATAAREVVATSDMSPSMGPLGGLVRMKGSTPKVPHWRWSRWNRQWR